MIQVEPMPQSIIEGDTVFALPGGPIKVLSSRAMSVAGAMGKEGVQVSESGTFEIAAGLTSEREVAQAAVEAKLQFERMPAEGFAFHIGPKGAVLVAADEKGLMYGAGALAKTLKGPSPMSEVWVQDWPDMPVRGVFLTLRMGPNDPEVMEALIRHMGSYRPNLLCVEINQALKWESHPEIAAPWAWDKPTMERMARLAEEEGMAFVPLVQSLHHVEYIVAHHPEMAEGPGTYCPNHPDARRLITDLMDEAVELFQPRFLHIGHDEVVTSYDLTKRETILRCPVCRGQEPPLWFAEDVRRIRDFLSSKGVGTMMWADMLLNPVHSYGWGKKLNDHYGGPPDEIWRCVDLIPKDIVMCDWHYEVTGAYPSHEYLRSKGFTVLGCPWKQEGIFTFTRYINKVRQRLKKAETEGLVRSCDALMGASSAPGALCTNWATVGQSTKEGLLEQVRWAGEFTWSPGRAAWLTPQLEQLAERMDAPNPTRDIPPGPFEIEIDLDELKGGLMWTAGMASLPILKPRRTGYMLLWFTARVGCHFEQATMTIHGKPAGPFSLLVGVNGSDPVWAASNEHSLAGEAIELTSLIQGAWKFQVRLDLRNDTDERAEPIKRIELCGRVSG